MGEYLSRRLKDGTIEQFAKAGTCDDFRYVRRSELEAWAPMDAGQGTDCKAALAEASILYRFPWPDEDEQTVNTMKDRNMFRTSAFVCKLDIEHDEKVAHVKARDGGHGVNMWIPCPVAFKGKMSNGGAQHVIQIVGERYEAGHVRTIFECAYCEKPFCVSGDDLAVVKLAWLEYQRAGDGMETYRDADVDRIKWFRAVAERFAAKVVKP